MDYDITYRYLSFREAELFTLICLPAAGEKYPAVIIRTPYVGKYTHVPEEEVCRMTREEASPWLEAGYAVVYQHCRGTGKSSGHCIPYIHEREDGLFLQDWIRQQPFYNGELYLWGGSYLSSVHFVTAPFAPDIKAAVLEVQDCQRYNCNYRNGFYKVGLHGGWYVTMYKQNSGLKKNYTPDSYRMLPLSDFSKTVFGESAPDFDAILQHPRREDPFWKTRYGGGEAQDAIRHAGIPILLVTGFYDIYTGGVFDMWQGLDPQTRCLCALAVHPYDHGGSPQGQPLSFENGALPPVTQYSAAWFDWVRGKGQPPFTPGKITYYKLFDNQWCTDDFYDANTLRSFRLGQRSVSYRYDPASPASFAGGLSANFGGTAWQDAPNTRPDIVTVYTPPFEADTYVKGKIRAKLRVRSDCQDTCFYMRLSLCKPEGDYGLRDDINQISNFDPMYRPGEWIDMEFSFDEHAFVVRKEEKLRIDISSSAYPHYVPHTNRRGLFSEQTAAKVANNQVLLEASFLELPVLKD